MDWTVKSLKRSWIGFRMWRDTLVYIPVGVKSRENLYLVIIASLNITFHFAFEY